MTNNGDLDRKIAAAQIYSNALITLGAVLTGFGVTIFTLFRSGDEPSSFEINGIQLEFYSEGILMMVGGLILIVLGVVVPRYLIYKNTK